MTFLLWYVVLSSVLGFIACWACGYYKAALAWAALMIYIAWQPISVTVRL